MKSRTAIIQLGRYGDIINILPLCKIIQEQDGENPTLLVNPDYLSLLEGVSYVNGIAFSPAPGTTDEQMVKSLESRFQRVLSTNVGGHGLAYERQCESFTKEAWHRAGMLAWWPLADMQDLFDNRDKDREAKLISAWIDPERPTILVQLSGTSSPYPFACRLWDELNIRYEDRIRFVNLASFRAHRFFDLLGLMEKADGLITIDTGTLHLSCCSSVRTIALVTDKPTLWHGAIPHVPRMFSMRYAESISRMEEIHDCISIGGDTAEFDHVYCDYPMVGDSLRRHQIALSTWGIGSLFSIRDGAGREFKDGIRNLPFVHDMVNLALNNRGAILLTNSDTCIEPFAFNQAKIDFTRPYWGSRRDFKKLWGPLEAREVVLGEPYPGADIFVIPGIWWEQHRNKLPDLIFGAEGWDCCLRELMRVTGGTELKDCCYHERHASVWERPENRYTLASQVHNRRLANEFLKSLNIDPVPHGL